MNETTDLFPYALERLGTVMEPELDNPLEVEGVLNPGTAWGPDGYLYLYPRLVSQGNVSRIGRARVIMGENGPESVERQGVVLQPDEGWERGTNNAGVEDPRITDLEELGVKVMTYIAYGPLGPKPAIAVSWDGIEWRRLGPLHFEYDPTLDADLNLFPNKDVVFFPEPITDPEGREAYGVLHRPMWDLGWLREGEGAHVPSTIKEERPSIWLGFVDARAVREDMRALSHIYGSIEVAPPKMDYEVAKVGAGPAPIRTPEGWLLLHHGVSGSQPKGFELAYGSKYAAGAILLDGDEPWREIARTETPLLAPETSDELVGTLGNVVFPTAIERIDGVSYVFYGMADSKIGVARLDRLK